MRFGGSFGRVSPPTFAEQKGTRIRLEAELSRRLSCDRMAADIPACLLNDAISRVPSLLKEIFAEIDRSLGKEPTADDSELYRNTTVMSGLF